MNKGYFKVSREWLSSTEWPQIQAAINLVFTLEYQVEVPGNDTQFYGQSDLFEPSGGMLPLYDCYVTRLESGEVVVKEMKKR